MCKNNYDTVSKAGGVGILNVCLIRLGCLLLAASFYFGYQRCNLVRPHSSRFARLASGTFYMAEEF